MTDPSHLIGVSDRPKWPGSRKTPREAGKRGPNSLVVAKGAQHSWTWLWGCYLLSKLRGEKIRINHELTSINMESRSSFFSPWLKLILASRSLKGNEKLMVIWYDGCLLVWFAANRASYLAEWLLVRLTKSIANVWWLSDFGEKGWTSIAKAEFLFEGCFCNTCFSLDVSREEQVLLAFFELLFVGKIQHWKNQLPASTIFRNGV